jgi:hypothetical protein
VEVTRVVQMVHVLASLVWVGRSTSRQRVQHITFGRSGRIIFRFEIVGRSSIGILGLQTPLGTGATSAISGRSSTRHGVHIATVNSIPDGK